MPTATESRLAEINARLAAIGDALKVIDTRARVEGEFIPQTDDETARRSQTLADLATESDTLVDEANALDEEARPLREQEARRSRVAGYLGGGGRFSEPGDAGGRRDPSVVSRTREIAYDDVVRRSHSFEGMPADDMVRRSHGALGVLEGVGVPSGGVDRLARLLAPAGEEEDLDVASVRRSAASELVLAASDPDYLAAFRRILRRPGWQGEPGYLSPEQYAAVSRSRRAHWRLLDRDGAEYVSRSLGLTNSLGGYLVPFSLDSDIVLSNAGAINPFRAFSRIEATATNTWSGVSSAGTSAAWLGEGAVVTDNSPTFANISITPQKLATWIYGSYEVLEDADFERQLPDLLFDAANRLTSTAFAVGSGTGQPFGAVVRANAVALAGGTITAAGVFSLHKQLPARFRAGRQVWVGNVAALDLLRTLVVGAGSVNLMLVGDTMTPWGERAYESSDMDGTIGVGGHKVLMYLDGASYIIVDRIGTSVIYEPMVKDQASGRPSGQGGWYMFARTGADASIAPAATGPIQVLSLT